MAETASLSQKRRLPESNRCKIPEGDVSASALLPELDICGHSSCPGSELDPEFPALVCTLPIGHGGMHHQEGVNCAWERP